MRSLSWTMPAALLLLLSVACNQNKLDRKEAKQDMPTAATADSAVAGGNPAYEQTTPNNNGTDKNPNQNKQVSASSAPAANPDWDKKIVKNASLTLEVKNFHSFNQELHKKIREVGGYIAQEDQNTSEYKMENTVTIKIPVAQFDETLLNLPSDSDKIVEKKIRSEDVTMEVVDTKSRMEAKRAVKERYLDLLKQAKNMDDIIKVQQEIDGVQEEIEGASGRVNYLGHAAAFSTINLSYYQVLDPAALNKPEPGFLHRLGEGIADGWNRVSDVLIALISLWPLWCLIGLSWAGYRRWKISGRKKTTAVS